MKRRRVGVASALIGGTAAVLLAAGTVLADLPTADDQPSVTTDHGVAKTITLTGTAAAGSADFTVSTGPSHGNLDDTTGTMACDSAVPANCSADVLYTPNPSYEGADAFTFNVHNVTDGTSADATVSITVGSTPIANDDPDVTCSSQVSSGKFTTLEDTPLTVGAASPCGLLANDTDGDAADTLSAALNTDGSLGSAAVGASGGFTYTPTANASGDDTFTYDASDGAASSTATVHVHITPVNDVPSFTAGLDPEVAEDSGAASISSWASAISAGANEGSQTVNFILFSDDNPGLFSALPAVSASGTLSFTPAADANGVAHVSFKIHDNGGTSNGGVDTSGSHSLTITVDPVNDAPSFTAGTDPSVSEDSGAFSATNWATNPSTGPANESGQAISYQVTSDDNSSLFSAGPAVSPSGTLTFTPAANRNGVAHLTIVAKDDSGTALGGTDTSSPAAAVTITVIAVNDPPNAVNDTTFSVAENSAGQLLNVLANDTSLPDAPEVLTVTAVTQGVHGGVTIALDGSSVTYTPVAGYYGSDFFTYTISDPGLLTDTATVLLTVAKDTTAPTITLPVQHIKTITTLSATGLSGQVTWSGADAGVGLARFDLQRSVNGAAFATLTLTSQTATALDLPFSIGAHYQFRVRSVDKNGNASAWFTGPVFTVARYQETNGFVHYGGTWSLTSNVSDSGGAAKWASVAGRWVSFTHVMRDVAFVGPRSSTRGSVDIYVDGVKVSAVSMKTTVTIYRQVIWQIHFSKIGTHTIKVVVRGNGRFDLDCFLLLT